MIAALGASATVVLSQLSLLASQESVRQARRQADIAEQSNIAVIATAGMTWDTPPIRDQKDTISVQFANVGRSPASFYVYQQIKFFKGVGGRFGVDKFDVGENESCKDENFREGSSVIFPSSNSFVKMPFSMSENDVNRSLDGVDALIYRGCIFYKQLGKLHHTQFCFIAEQSKTLASPGGTPLCDGNFAD